MTTVTGSRTNFPPDRGWSKLKTAGRLPLKLHVQPRRRSERASARPERESPALAIAKAVANESRDGVILFDADGVLHRNEAAELLLSEPAVAREMETTLRSLWLSGLPANERLALYVNGLSVAAASLPAPTAGERIGILTIWHRSRLPTEMELRGRFGFTPRESQVALLLAERRTDAEIADALGISWHTVRSHVERIFLALGCHSRREAWQKLRSA